MYIRSSKTTQQPLKLKAMEFSKIQTPKFAYVIRSIESAEQENDFIYVKDVKSPKNDPKALYRIPARDVKIGETIYNKDLSYLSYRVE